MCGLCLLELLVGVEGAAGALDDVGGGPDAAPHPGLQVAALAVLRQEPAHEGVARAVGVHDLVLVELDDGDLGHLALLHHDHWVGALREAKRAR